MTKHRRARVLLPLLLTTVACAASQQEPAWDRPFEFNETRRVVTIGDNVAANPSYARSYVALLGKNDDTLFPSFQGKDFATRLPGVKFVRVDHGGASFAALAAAKTPICTCSGADCPTDRACLDHTDDAPTLVVVQLGANDLFQVVLRMLNDDALRADYSGATAIFRENVRKVLAIASDPARFHRKPRIIATNVPDPSDGVGDIANLATALFPIKNVEKITPELALGVIAAFNGVIKEEAERAGATFVDLHAHYLGHGMHYQDPETPHYVATDATTWLRSVVDPNLRGAHEVRRLFWNALTGESEQTIPIGLPPDATLDLPAVPDQGWAKAVVTAEITQELESAELGTLPNVSADPTFALGKPDSHDRVALGIAGAFIVLDMGEGTEVSDGMGDDLVVLEQGAASGGAPEPYRVYVATAAEGPFVQVADGMGERSFDLSSTGVKKARYVRVESLADEYDVLHGLGSPYYPGPEIDAVGAVYPGGAP